MLGTSTVAGMERRGLHSSAEGLFILRSHGALGTGTGSRCGSVGGGDGVGEMVRKKERLGFLGYIEGFSTKITMLQGMGMTVKGCKE